jgi:hypothetical protein
MNRLGIDPGTTHSAFCIFDGARVLDSGWIENDAMRNRLLNPRLGFAVQPDTVAIEMIASYGMAVGREVFETCLWIGRFYECSPAPVGLLYRKDIKLHLCGSARAKDPNVRQALIDRFGPVGTKKNPGPLHGVSKHIWAALAVAVLAHDAAEKIEAKP